MIIAFPISARVAARQVVAHGKRLADRPAARPRLTMSWSVDASGRPVARWREEDVARAANDDPLSHRLGRLRLPHRPPGRFHAMRMNCGSGFGVLRGRNLKRRSFPEARCRKIGRNIV